MMLSVSGVGLLDGMSIPRDKLIVMITTNNCQHQPRHKITLFPRFVRIKLSSLVKTYQKGIALYHCIRHYTIIVLSTTFMKNIFFLFCQRKIIPCPWHPENKLKFKSLTIAITLLYWGSIRRGINLQSKYLIKKNRFFGKSVSTYFSFFMLSTVVKFDNKNIPCVFDDERYEKLPSAILKII